MNRIVAALALVLSAAFIAGCGSDPLTIEDARKYGEDCRRTGEAKFECSYTDARDRLCIVKVDDYYSDNTEITCKDDNTPVCNAGSDNSSGNVCRIVKSDGTECVAVLPDGESNRDKDNIECGDPKAKVVK